MVVSTVLTASPLPPPVCEARMVSMITATMSSSTVTPSATWPVRSWPRFNSPTIFAMTAELETMNMAATNSD